MRSIKQLSFIGLAVMLVLSSCTMEKRVYMSGYHIEWNKTKHTPGKAELASNDNVKQTEQDQIVTAERSENEIGTNDDNIIASIDNAIIVPSNKTTLISKRGNTVAAKTPSISKTKIVTANKVSKSKMKAEKKNAAGGKKVQWVAFLLCFFLGLIGVHRFYLGYTGMGILYIFTLGIFGIGWLIDLILLIIPNGLSPKDESGY